MSTKTVREAIELRKTIRPEDDVYDFIIKIREHLGTDKNTVILSFILTKASKLSFNDFILERD